MGPFHYYHTNSYLNICEVEPLTISEVEEELLYMEEVFGLTLELDVEKVV